MGINSAFKGLKRNGKDKRQIDRTWNKGEDKTKTKWS